MKWNDPLFVAFRVSRNTTEHAKTHKKKIQSQVKPVCELRLLKRSFTYRLLLGRRPDGLLWACERAALLCPVDEGRRNLQWGATRPSGPFLYVGPDYHPPPTSPSHPHPSLLLETCATWDRHVPLLSGDNVFVYCVRAVGEFPKREKTHGRNCTKTSHAFNALKFLLFDPSFDHLIDYK